MSSSLLSIPINEDSYEELIDKYIGIFGVSSPTRSIVSKIAIGQERAEMSLTILDIESGESSVCEDVVFVNDESFYEKFIIRTVKDSNPEQIIFEGTFNVSVKKLKIAPVLKRQVQF